MTVPASPLVLLRAIAGGDSALTLVQIIAEPLATPDFAGKFGWLRYPANLMHSNALPAAPPTPDAILLDGEWVVTPGACGASVKRNARGWTRITEKPVAGDTPDAGWTPVLRQVATTRAKVTDGLPGGDLAYHVYFGFRDGHDADDGMIRRVADRLVEFREQKDV